MFYLLLYTHAGTPSAATLSAVSSGSSFDTLTITVFPPTYGAECPILYTIFTTDSNNTVIPDFNVTTNRDGAAVQTMRSGFDLCYEFYNFSVVAFSKAGYGVQSGSFPQDPVDYLG